MYKNNLKSIQRFATILRHITLWLTFLTFLSTVKAQDNNPSIQLSGNNLTISEAFKSISNQSGLSFTYDQHFDINKQVDFSKTKVTLSEIMTRILKDTNRKYVVSNGFVLIMQPKEEQKVELPKIDKIITQKLSGNITSTEGKPIYNATVDINGKNEFTTYTDQKGTFTISEISDDTYTVAITHTDFNAKEYNITIEKGQSKEVSFILQEKNKEPNAIVEVPVESISKDTDMSNHIQSSSNIKPQTRLFAVKTNLLMDLTATINLGTEIKLADKITIDVPFSFNAWTFKNNKKWRHFITQPEVRWWKQESFKGYFIGANLMYGMYNIGNINLPFNLWSDLKNYRYQGHIFGGGVSIGHQWTISNHWNLEANIGVGYFYTNYTKKECDTCGEFIKKDKKHYFGPTKAGVSLIYIIK